MLVGEGQMDVKMAKISDISICLPHPKSKQYIPGVNHTYKNL